MKVLKDNTFIVLQSPFSLDGTYRIISYVTCNGVISDLPHRGVSVKGRSELFNFN